MENQHYKVYINDEDIIETKYYEDLDVETITKVIEFYNEFSRKLTSENKQVRILVDYSAGGGNSSTEARKIAVEGINKLSFYKLAIFGGSTYLRILTNLVIKAIGRGQKIKYFKSRKEAVMWLKL